MLSLFLIHVWIVSSFLLHLKIFNQSKIDSLSTFGRSIVFPDDHSVDDKRSVPLPESVTMSLFHRVAVLQVYQIAAFCFRDHRDLFAPSSLDKMFAQSFIFLRDNIFRFMFDSLDFDAFPDVSFLSKFQLRIGYVVHCNFLFASFPEKVALSRTAAVHPSCLGLLKEVATEAEEASESEAEDAVVIPNTSETLLSVSVNNLEATRLLVELASTLKSIVDNLQHTFSPEVVHAFLEITRGTSITAVSKSTSKRTSKSTCKSTSKSPTKRSRNHTDGSSSPANVSKTFYQAEFPLASSLHFEKKAPTTSMTVPSKRSSNRISNRTRKSLIDSKPAAASSPSLKVVPGFCSPANVEPPLSSPVHVDKKSSNVGQFGSFQNYKNHGVSNAEESKNCASEPLPSFDISELPLSFDFEDEMGTEDTSVEDKDDKDYLEDAEEEDEDMSEEGVEEDTNDDEEEVDTEEEDDDEEYPYCVEDM